MAKYLAVDAYFSKLKFITAVAENGLDLIGKLRRDANMRYPYLGPRRPGRGRPKEFDGKVQWNTLQWDRFTGCQEEDLLGVWECIL